MTAPATPPTLREYEVRARSTDIFGRVLCSAREHHFIVDGPVQNGCPGEEVTPAEVFLSAVAACGTELIQVLAKDQGVRVSRVAVRIHGIVDRANQPRADVTTFNSVRIDVTLAGPSAAQAAALVDGFKARCPLYGSVAVATKDVVVSVKVADA
jgi:uncharacterized OsmC-like protein